MCACTAVDDCSTFEKKLVQISKKSNCVVCIQSKANNYFYKYWKHTYVFM